MVGYLNMKSVISFQEQGNTVTKLLTSSVGLVKWIILLYSSVEKVLLWEFLQGDAVSIWIDIA